MNRVNLAGYLADDPKPINTSGSGVGARIRIAARDLQRASDTHFISCIAWNQTANYILTYLKKGDFVTIDGRITVRNYVNAESKKISTMDITVDVLRSGGKSSGNYEGYATTKTNLTKEVASLDEAFPENVDLNLDDAFGIKEIEPQASKNNHDELDEKVSWSDDLED